MSWVAISEIGGKLAELAANPVTSCQRVEFGRPFVETWSKAIRLTFSSNGMLAAVSGCWNHGDLAIVLFRWERSPMPPNKMTLSQVGQSFLEHDDPNRPKLSFWIDCWPGSGDQFPVVFWTQEDSSLSITQIQVGDIRPALPEKMAKPMIKYEIKDPDAVGSSVVEAMRSLEQPLPQKELGFQGVVIGSSAPDIILNCKDIRPGSIISVLPCCSSNQFIIAYVDSLKRLVIEVYSLVETAGGPYSVREHLQSKFLVTTFKDHDFSKVTHLQLQRSLVAGHTFYCIAAAFENHRLLQLRVDDSGLAVYWTSFEMDTIPNGLESFGFSKSDIKWKPTIPTFGPNTLIMLHDNSNRLLIGSQKPLKDEPLKEFTVSLIKLSLII